MRQDPLSVLCLPATLVVFLGVVGCSEDTDGSGAGTTPNPPTGTTGPGTNTSEGSESESSGDEPCTDSTMCDSGGFCAAIHTAGQTAPPAEGICMEECVPLEHVSLWCMDDPACCEGTCDETSGFCVAEEGTGTSTTTDTTDTGTSTEPGTTTTTTTHTGTSTSTTTTTSSTGSGTTTTP